VTSSDQSPHWQPATTPPELGDDEIHIWYLPLSITGDRLEQFLGVLSIEETERAAKFAFPYLRQRYTAAHGMLRLILGSVLNRDPTELSFRNGDHGKPFLVEEDLQFNLSHSSEHGLLAVTPRTEIGVDIEGMSRKVDTGGIAERFFSEREAGELFSLEDEHQRHGFFNLWTRKEAWLKATGIGITEGLNKVEFNCRPGEPARLLRINGQTEEAANWHINTFSTPANEFIGSVAIKAKPGGFQFFTYD
jgi:4'-phosphopantetheinyl transferase